MSLKEQIQRVLDGNRFAVLATQCSGQPHASLMAFTPVSGLRYLVFATYRGTLKYRSLLADARVAVLIDGQDGKGTRPNRRLVLTALGEAIEIPEAERQAAVKRPFGEAPGSEGVPWLARLRARARDPSGAYEVVGGIDDVQWYHVSNPAAT